MRKDLRRWLRRLHDELHITSVFVTHDQEEALEVADRIVVMNHGKVEQIGSPQEVYDHPKTPFVYEFLGNVNIFDTVDGKEYVRPHEITVSRDYFDESISATLTLIHAIGPVIHLEVKRLDNAQFVDIELSREKFNNFNWQTGEAIFIKPNRAA